MGVSTKFGIGNTSVLELRSSCLRMILWYCSKRKSAAESTPGPVIGASDLHILGMNRCNRPKKEQSRNNN
jgi:hypothetical protein